MERYVLNGENLIGRDESHDEAARALKLPAHYGRNLDALWDEVSTLRGEILVQNAVCAGTYGQRVINLIREAAAENPQLKLIVE